MMLKLSRADERSSGSQDESLFASSERVGTDRVKRPYWHKPHPAAARRFKLLPACGLLGI